MANVLEKTTGSALPPLYRKAADRMKALMAALRKSGYFIPIPADREDEDSRFSPWILQAAFQNKYGKNNTREIKVRAQDENGI
ncbi:MAG: cysteine desulfurase, partial [Treponema sp.]|nr:cysteine desulfurase [Treponema sp.]